MKKKLPKTCTYGKHDFAFSDRVSQQDRTVQFVKLQMVSFYGDSGGLRFLSFDGTLKEQGRIIKHLQHSKTNTISYRVSM